MITNKIFIKKTEKALNKLFYKKYKNNMYVFH
jgi:hypothetical protein